MQALKNKEDAIFCNESGALQENIKRRTHLGRKGRQAIRLRFIHLRNVYPIIVENLMSSSFVAARD